MPVFDISFDDKSDKPRKTRPDADRDSSRLLLDRKLLRPKKLRSGAPFAPIAPSARRDDYLVLIDASGASHWYGSDAERGPAVPLP